MSMFYELMMKKKGIPSRYQEVEYIESYGTQYINTGIVPTMDISFKLVASKVGSYVDNNMFGSRKTSGTSTDLLGIITNTSLGVNILALCNSGAGWGGADTCSIPYDNDFHTYIATKDTLTIDTNTIQHTAQNYSTNDLPMYLFGLNNRGNAQLSAQKVKSLQISDNNRLVRNFIPVYDTETQKYGMWESVERKFYGNDGTGDFKGSIVGYTIVGSPTITDGVVSGFVDRVNYLSIPQLTVEQIGTNSEFICKFNSQNNFFPLFSMGTNQGLWIYLRSDHKIRVKIGNATQHDFVVSNDIDLTQDHICKVIFKNYSCSVYLDGNLIETFLFETPTNTTYSGEFRIGGEAWVQSSGYAFTGCTIDLNYTQVKENNKLYFNGQPSA